MKAVNSHLLCFVLHFSRLLASHFHFFWISSIGGLNLNRCCLLKGVWGTDGAHYYAVKKVFVKSFAKFFEFFQIFREFFEAFASFSRLSDPFGPIGMHSEAIGSVWMFSKTFESFWIFEPFFNVSGRIFLQKNFSTAQYATNRASNP